MTSAGTEAELEKLRREREEKIRQIAEKRRQVEDLKRRRAARAEERGAATGTENRRASGDLGRSVDTLVAEILGGGPAPSGGTGGRPSPEGPLRELAVAAVAAGPAARGLQLQTSLSVATVVVDPTEANVYDRSCQTDVDDEPKNVLMRGTSNVLLKMAEKAKQRAVRPDEAAASQPGRLVKRTVLANQNAAGDLVPENIAKEAAAALEPAAQKPVELNPEERDRILKHPDFNAFFERTTLLVERALGQQSWDVCADFRDSGTGEDGTEADSAGRMKHVDDYIEERWGLGRPVTDVRFSPRREEVFLAAYGVRANPSLSDPDGCMLVWNLAMRNRPELAFSCQSAVLTAQFNRFDPSLFFGGTYAGGVVLWDARAKSGPVLRTPLSGKGHSHPVQAMQQVGTQNATNLVTASNDGRLCVWSLVKWDVPTETIDLKNETRNKRDLAVTALSFPENETSVLYVGAEDGSICQVHMHGSKVGVTELYDGHEGPVAGLDLHPHSDASQHGVEGNAELAVSCSFDWSVKLWMVKQYQQPVLSLDVFEDYVYDVAWHPYHPAAFAAVDGEGHVDLWNLNRSTECATVRCEHPNQRKNALNHCRWSIDGRKLVTGDSEGMLSVYGVDKALAQPRNEDFQQFQDKVRTFQPILARHRETSFGLSDSRYAQLPGRLQGGGAGGIH